MEKGLIHVAGRAPFAGDLAAEVDRLGALLLRLHHGLVAHEKKAIILIEGWDGAYKTSALRRIMASLEPCHARVECLAPAERRDRARHWLAPFWAGLPTGGQALFYFHSYYSRLAHRMLADEAGERDVLRAIDEMNEFEAQQRDHGTIFLKLFFHNPVDVQRRVVEERRRDPWLRAIDGDRPVASLEDRPRHEAVWERLISETDYRWSSWSLVNASTEGNAIVEAMTAVCDGLGANVPEEPPLILSPVDHGPLAARA